MRQVMIDIETLDTLPTAAIISIGACVFDPSTGKTTDPFHEKIDWETALFRRSVSASTLQFWMKQSDEARMSVMNKGAPMENVLKQFEQWYPKVPVWSNGATFDIVILENAYRQRKMDIPWKFWNTRDVRTMYDVADTILGTKERVPFEGIQHNALDDAVNQAENVMLMWQRLGDSVQRLMS